MHNLCVYAAYRRHVKLNLQNVRSVFINSTNSSTILPEQLNFRHYDRIKKSVLSRKNAVIQINAKGIPGLSIDPS